MENLILRPLHQWLSNFHEPTRAVLYIQIGTVDHFTIVFIETVLQTVPLFHTLNKSITFYI